MVYFNGNTPKYDNEIQFFFGFSIFLFLWHEIWRFQQYDFLLKFISDYLILNRRWRIVLTLWFITVNIWVENKYYVYNTVLAQTINILISRKSYQDFLVNVIRHCIMAARDLHDEKRSDILIYKFYFLYGDASSRISK